MRKVRIYSTVGANNQVIDFEGSTFKDLKSALSNLEFDLRNKKFVIGENRTTLEHPDAILPEGDFTLFIMPVKTKSGALSRKEAFAKIREFIEIDGNKAREFFNKDKNFTNKSTSELETLLSKYSRRVSKRTKQNNVSNALKTGSKRKGVVSSQSYNKEIASILLSSLKVIWGEISIPKFKELHSATIVKLLEEGFSEDIPEETLSKIRKGYEGDLLREMAKDIAKGIPGVDDYFDDEDDDC